MMAGEASKAMYNKNLMGGSQIANLPQGASSKIKEPLAESPHNLFT
jgi:hypothetical protein